MKPYIEQIAHEPDFTWRMVTFPKQQDRFEWHYHLEYELVLMRNATGQLFVGSYSGPYQHNTLALFGPRLPHASYLDQPYQSDNLGTLVLWFSHSWVFRIIESMPQLKPLKKLLVDSQYGLAFSHDRAEQVFQLLTNNHSLTVMQQTWRVIEVLILLAESNSIRLNTAGLAEISGDDEAQQKIARAIYFIDQHYREPVTIQQLAEHLHLSVSSVQRLFEKHFLESFSEHLKLYRIGKACELLINTQRPIALIAEQAGFSNLSNFNRQFKHVKSLTPREFRLRYKTGSNKRADISTPTQP